jgi:hypothetical protein
MDWLPLTVHGLALLRRTFSRSPSRVACAAQPAWKRLSSISIPRAKPLSRQRLLCRGLIEVVSICRLNPSHHRDYSLFNKKSPGLSRNSSHISPQTH